MKNYEEIIDALKAGETLINEDEIKLKLKNGALYNIGCGMVDNWSFSCPGEWEIYKEPKWYENIPEGGVLCWANSNVVLICSYGEADRELEDDDFRTYARSLPKPMTKGEIKTFMDNAPQ